MPPTEEVADSTDWLTTPLASFAPLDAALRCQVCKDFYNTPMITSCSHTFCSLCIRRCLSTDGKCPTCRSGDQPSKLRRNWTVQELVDAFASARPQGLELARKAQQEREENEQPKRKRRRIGEADINAAPARQTRSSGRRGANSVAPSQETMILDSEDDDIEEYHPEPEPEPKEPKDGLVACPMCNKRMKEELVFTHLDRCTQDNDDNPVVSKSRKAKTPPLKSPIHAIDLTASPAKHLPHLNYSLLRDNALKKKLQEAGIPAWGARQLLIRRHSQWVDIFNANSDSSRPRSKGELLKDLDTWERTQGGNAPGQGQTGPTSVMRKDFDGDEWTGRHKGQFDDLIAAARAKVKSAKAKAAEHAAEAAHDASKSLETKAKPPDDMPQASLSTGLSDMDQLKAEQEAIASRTEPVTSKTLNEPISGAQAFLQHAAEDIPMRDATPPSLPSHQQEDFNPLPSSHERHTAHDQRRYSNANPPSSQYHTPAGSPPQEIASLQRADLLPEKLASLEGTRRVPMFQVPEDPVHDNEGFGATSGG